MQCKFSPVCVAKINFPGFQEILDFTSAGSESSVSVTVDGDTDKEYRIDVYNLTSTKYCYLRLNNDSTAGKYGYQYLFNNAGSISAARGTLDHFRTDIAGKALGTVSLLTPAGFIKTLFLQTQYPTTGTTIEYFWISGHSFNDTANITTLNFLPDSGNFTAGTRITVYARRSNV